MVLRGGPHAGTYSAWVLPLNAGGLSQEHRLTGGIGEIVLDPGNLTLMERAGIMRLAESLGRNATPLEDSLLRAQHIGSPNQLCKKIRRISKYP